jgi:hypothetical protein
MDSRDIKFVKFGPVDYFTLILQDSAKQQFEKLNLNSILTGFDWGAVWTGYVARSHWPIPFRY